MKCFRLLCIISSLISFVFAFTSCHQTPPEDLEMPSEDCVMVYTTSENEYIRILHDYDSQFNLLWRMGKEDC